MAILKRLDYIIKKTSVNDINAQINGVVSNLNTRQNNPSNKKGGVDAYVFYASLFDPRTEKEYLVFSEKAKTDFAVGADSLLLTPDVASATINNDELVNLIVAELQRRGLMGVKIDDNAKSSDKTYSSNKIEELVENAKNDELLSVNMNFLLSL